MILKCCRRDLSDFKRQHNDFEVLSMQFRCCRRGLSDLERQYSDFEGKDSKSELSTVRRKG